LFYSPKKRAPCWRPAENSFGISRGS